MPPEDLSEHDIFASAGQPAEANHEERQPEPAPRDTAREEPERPASQLGQAPRQGDDAQPQPEGQQAAPQDPPRRTMLDDLKDERKRRQDFERQVAERDRQLAERDGAMRQMREMFGQMQGQGRGQPQPQAPQQPTAEIPDPFLDPQGFARHQVMEVLKERMGPYFEQQQTREQNLGRQLQSLHRGMAVSQYGADAAREAEEAFNTAAARQTIDPHEHQRITSSDNPFAAAVEWHRRQRAFETVGADPNQWFETETQRRLREDPAFQQQVMSLLQGQAHQAAGAPAPAAGRPPPVFTGLPPSLNGAPGSPGQQAAPISEADIFAAAPPKMGGRR